LPGERELIDAEVSALVNRFASLSTAEMATTEQITSLIQAQTAPLLRRIEELSRSLQQATSVNVIAEYQVETIDDNIRCEETLDVIKSLPLFNGKSSYVSWREAANNSMKLYVKGSRKYYAALTVLRNKVTDDANDILTNHGTVLNLEAILSRLDFAYADKRPLHIIEQELSIMRQGSLTIIDYYNEVNKKLTALINKTIMTHGSNSELTKELNKKNRQYALRVFITGLNPPLANIIFSLSPTDLPNALAKAQELESNNIRANFAFQFNKTSSPNNYNSYKPNTLRFPQRTQSNPRNNFSNRAIEAKPEPMDIGSSANLVQPRENFNNNNSYQTRSFRPNFNNNNGNNFQQGYPFQGYQRNPVNPNGLQQGAKRQPTSAQINYQPFNKAQRINNLTEELPSDIDPNCIAEIEFQSQNQDHRINNLDEEAFLDIDPDCPTSVNEEYPEEITKY